MDTNNLNQHSFLLKPLSFSCFYKIPFQAQFVHEAKSLQQNHTTSLLYPIINKDKHFFTPTFVTSDVQEFSNEKKNSWLEHEKRKFIQKTKLQIADNHSQEVFFKGKDFSFCSVCQLKYEYYHKHINDKEHQSNIKKNKRNKYIHKLCKVFKKKSPHSHEVNQNAIRKEYQQLKGNLSQKNIESNQISQGKFTITQEKPKGTHSY